MTITEMNAACSLRHIEVLAAHGAEVNNPNGRQPLNADFFHYAMAECEKKGFTAVCYELYHGELVVKGFS